MEALPKKPARKPAAHKPVAAKKPRVAKPAPVHHEPAAKEVVSESVVETEKPVTKVVHGKNFYAVGRRKTSVAQTMLTSGNGTVTINKIPLENYFGTPELQFVAKQSMTAVGLDKSLNAKVKVSGGGIHSQAEAVRHSLARAIIAMNPESRRTVKKLGFLMRDPRVKERKKPGLKRARRAPQFSKR